MAYKLGNEQTEDIDSIKVLSVNWINIAKATMLYELLVSNCEWPIEYCGMLAAARGTLSQRSGVTSHPDRTS